MFSNHLTFLQPHCMITFLYLIYFAVATFYHIFSHCNYFPACSRLIMTRKLWIQNCSRSNEKEIKYTKSLVNTNLVNTNFTNTHFQKIPIPHLTRTMKQKFLHQHEFYLILYKVTYLTQNLVNTNFFQNQK